MEFLSGPSPIFLTVNDEQQEQSERERNIIRRRGAIHLVDQAVTFPNEDPNTVKTLAESKRNDFRDLGIPGEYVLAGDKRDPSKGFVKCTSYNYDYHHDRFWLSQGHSISDLDMPGGLSRLVPPAIGCRNQRVVYFKPFGGTFANPPADQCSIEKVYLFYADQCNARARRWEDFGNQQQASQWRFEAADFARIAGLARTACQNEKEAKKTADLSKAISNLMPNVSKDVLDRRVVTFASKALANEKALLAAASLDLANRQKNTFPGLVDDAVTPAPGTNVPFLDFRPGGRGTGRQNLPNILPGGPDVVPDAKDVFPGSESRPQPTPGRVALPTKKEKDNTTLYVILGVGAAALIAFSVLGSGRK